jgi:hypothetical protein
MNRLNRASALGLAEARPAGRVSRGFGGSDGWRCCACADRAPVRLRGVTSPASATRSAVGSFPGRGAPPRSIEPFPFGLSPGPGNPGSFGEVTHGS